MFDDVVNPLTLQYLCNLAGKHFDGFLLRLVEGMVARGVDNEKSYRRWSLP